MGCREAPEGDEQGEKYPVPGLLLKDKVLCTYCSVLVGLQFWAHPNVTSLPPDSSSEEEKKTPAKAVVSKTPTKAAPVKKKAESSSDSSGNASQARGPRGYSLPRAAVAGFF